MTLATLLGLCLAVIAPIKLPFTVDASTDDSASFPNAPQVQSFSFAQWQGRWVFIGGRMVGYHALGGATADFSRADANRQVWVVDTTTRPAKTYSVPVDLLPERLALVKDEWMSTGQLFYQDGSALYIAGGYGQDSSGHWVTFPLLSRVDLPSLIHGVMQGKLVADSVAFSRSTLVQSAGGDLIKLADDYFYVVMGHVFTGSYTAFEAQGEHNAAPVSQAYLNEIRKVQIVSDGHGALTVTLVNTFRDESEFRRRDLNVTKILSPKGLGLAAYGGVFTPDTQLSYSKPIYLFASGSPFVDSTFDQKMNAYNCAKLLVYDQAERTMYTTFLGGISRFVWDPIAGKFVENTRAGSKTARNYLDGMQWSDQISTICKVMAEGKRKPLKVFSQTYFPALSEPMLSSYRREEWLVPWPVPTF